MQVRLKKKYRAQSGGPDKDAAICHVEGLSYYVKSGNYRARTGPLCCNSKCGAAWRRRLAKFSKYRFR